MAAANGVATFSDLSIGAVGSYTLAATDPGHATSANSDAFTIGSGVGTLVPVIVKSTVPPAVVNGLPVRGSGYSPVDRVHSVRRI